jgi:hypothetical protein
MKRIIMMLALTALLVVALSLSAVTAFAASKAERDCLADGGTFSSDGGTRECKTVDQPGQSEKGNGDPPPGSTDINEGQGNLDNDSPKPKNIKDDCTQNPPTSNGNFAC